MTTPRNPTVLGGELLAKWFYQAMQNSAPQHSRTPQPPWDLLDMKTQQWMARAGNEVIAHMVSSGVITPGAMRVTELPASNVTTLTEGQRGSA